MIKKVVLFARSLITLIRIVMYGLYDDSRKIMGVRVISQQQADSMTAQKTLSITSEQLFIEGCAVPYDADSERYYLSQSMDYRLWQGVLTCDSNYDIYIVRPSKRKAELISTGTPLNLLICNDDSYSLKEITVSGIPVVSLTMEYEQGEETYGQITVIETSSGGRENVFEVQNYKCSYHKRGGMSIDFPKSSYKINLYNDKNKSKDASLIGMRDDNDWILNPLYADATRMREKIAYDIWNNITDLSEHTLEYCELILNNTYAGLYCLQEPVDAKTFGQTKSNAITFAIKGWNMGLTGITLMRDDALRILERGGNENLEIELESAPDGKTADALEIMRFLSIEGYESPYLNISWDEGSIFEHGMLVEMILARDNTYKNQKICAVPEAGGYVLYRSAWDLDISMQNMRLYEFDVPVPETDDIMDDYFLANDNATMLECKELYSLFRDNFYNMPYISSRIDEYAALLKNSGAYNRELAVWDDAMPLEESVSLLKTFFADRIEFLDEYYGGELWNTGMN